MQNGTDEGGTLRIVNGTEVTPAEGAEQQARLTVRRDEALATIIVGS